LGRELPKKKKRKPEEKKNAALGRNKKGVRQEAGAKAVRGPKNECEGIDANFLEGKWGGQGKRLSNQKQKKGERRRRVRKAGQQELSGSQEGRRPQRFLGGSRNARSSNKKGRKER